MIRKNGVKFDQKFFKKFTEKKNIPFDPVTGIIKLGNQQVIVRPDGLVLGDEPSKSRVEQWVQQCRYKL